MAQARPKKINYLILLTSARFYNSINTIPAPEVHTIQLAPVVKALPTQETRFFYITGSTSLAAKFNFSFSFLIFLFPLLPINYSPLDLFSSNLNQSFFHFVPIVISSMIKIFSNKYLKIILLCKILYCDYLSIYWFT